MGEGERGRGGEGEIGRGGDRENIYFFLLPSSLFLLPSSFFNRD
jgi:hypothetical protein